MTTVHRYDKLPIIPESYLELDQLFENKLYEIKSEHIEPIAIFIGEGRFYGLHIEDRPGVFSCRISSQEHHSLYDDIFSGVKPIEEVGSIDFTVDRTSSKEEIATLLTEQLANYYQNLQAAGGSDSLSREEAAAKHRLFLSITKQLARESLSIDQYGQINLASLRDGLESQRSDHVDQRPPQSGDWH